MVRSGSIRLDLDIIADILCKEFGLSNSAVRFPATETWPYDDRSYPILVWITRGHIEKVDKIARNILSEKTGAAMSCPKCAQRNPSNNKYCTKCGALLSSSAGQAVTKKPPFDVVVVPSEVRYCPKCHDRLMRLFYTPKKTAEKGKIPETAYACIKCDYYEF